MSSNSQSNNNEPVRERAIALTQDTTLQKLDIEYIVNHYGDKNKVNMRPAYQRHLRWSIENYIAFIKTIMILGYIPNIVLYKLHDDDRQELESTHKHECVDGQHRLNAIMHYRKSEPITINKKEHMITWYHEESETHVFYEKNENTEKWANENTEKKVSYMTENEQSHFNECLIPIDLILCKLTYDQRCDMFVSLQQGKLVRNSDLFKNYVDIPLISHIHKAMKMEETYRNTICPRLTTNSNQNWIFCVVRMFMIILESHKVDDWVKTTDTQVKKKIQKKMPKIMSITKEQIQYAETKINKWISFLDNLTKDIKFTPIQMLATFVYFQETDINESNLVIRLSGWASNATTEKKRMWYQKDYRKEFNGITTQYQYYKECLDYLHSDSLPEKPIVDKRKPFTTKKRNQLWERDFGKDKIGSCHTCGTNINKTAKWHAGHIESHADGGSDDDMDNFIVQCRKCNLECGTENAIKFKENNYDVV
jgi:hypothetical protein